MIWLIDYPFELFVIPQWTTLFETKHTLITWVNHICTQGYLKTINVTVTAPSPPTAPGADITTNAASSNKILSATTQDPVSISNKSSYCKISQSLEAARFVFRIVQSLWNLIGTSVAVLPMCLSYFKAIWWFKLPITPLWDEILR